MPPFEYAYFVSASRWSRDKCVFIYFILELLWTKSDNENDLQIPDDIEIKCREN
jgi:hypothetical protein